MTEIKTIEGGSERCLLKRKDHIKKLERDVGVNLEKSKKGYLSNGNWGNVF